MTRRKFRFLNHLPLTTRFAFVEVDLSSVVSSATLASFADALRQRQERREQRTKEQERQDRESQLRLQRSLSTSSPRARARGEVDVDEELAAAHRVVASSLDDPSLFPLLAESPSASPRLAARAAPGGWSAVAQLGFASSTTWAPLGPAALDGPPAAQPSPPPASPAAARPAAVPPAALQGAWGGAAPAPAAGAAPPSASKKKEKRLLFSMGAARPVYRQ